MSIVKVFFDGLNEKERRLYAGLRARELGYYGVSQVSQELGIHPHTVRAGQKELAALSSGAPGCAEPGCAAPGCGEPTGARLRRVGGGRKKKSIRSQS